MQKSHVKKWLFLCALINIFNIHGLNEVSVHNLLKKHTDISYIKCYDAVYFSYPTLPISKIENHPFRPTSGVFAETFILRIPKGKVLSDYGLVMVDDNLIQELWPQNMFPFHYKNLLSKFDMHNKIPKKITGRVAVISQPNADIYGHWIGEFLGRLALLEKSGIEYDWLYVPYNKKYIRETLSLLNIDIQKIIEPYGENFYIEADELIVPSLPARRSSLPVYNPLIMLCQKWHIHWLRETFLSRIEQYKDAYDFADKIFISRKNANLRKVVNEDEVFALFEARGFSRYCLENLSLIEQFVLFSKAKVIVGLHGSGLMNIVFCQPGTRVVEIFQKQFDSTFWQLSQWVHLQHDCIATAIENINMADIKNDTVLPLSVIKQYLADKGADL